MEEQYRSYWGVIPGEVMHDKELPHAGKLLYLVLSSMAGKNGYCWPANETLAAELDLSKRRVRELLAMDVSGPGDPAALRRGFAGPSGGELPPLRRKIAGPSGEISHCN